MKRYLLLPVSIFFAHTLTAQTVAKTPKSIRLVDKHFNLSGTLSGESAQSLVGLEAGDKLIINCTRLTRNGSIGILIKDYNKGTELYKRDGFDTLRDQSITVPAKGIYSVRLKSGSLLDKDVQLIVDREPAGHVVTELARQFDTTSTELVNTTTRVFAKNSGQGNKIVLSISLPPNTTYWTFWIGAGKSALDGMKAFDASCATVGSLFPSVNPMVLYGMKYINALPMATPGAQISYHFMDTQNANAFKSNQQYSFYTFKSAEKITTEYSFMINHQQDLNLGISNESSNVPQDVQIRVVAFVVKPKGK